jgi:cytochrome b561
VSRYVPHWLVTLLIVIVVIILLAIVVSALGGFDWTVQVGHFHWDIGVRR